MRLLDRFLVDRAELRAAFGLAQAEVDAEVEGRDVLRLLGEALWDVFSNNHRVVDADDVQFDLGSFRGSAGEIADALNARYRPEGAAFGYMDFYMGGMHGDGGPASAYRWIFRRLKAAGCDWIYTFPRLYLIDFGHRKPPDMTEYDPSEAVRTELESTFSEVDDLASQLDRDYEEAVAKAHDRPLPLTVVAYREVFGHLPRGWPRQET